MCVFTGDQGGVVGIRGWLEVVWLRNLEGLFKRGCPGAPWRGSEPVKPTGLSDTQLKHDAGAKVGGGYLAVLYEKVRPPELDRPEAPLQPCQRQP